MPGLLPIEDERFRIDDALLLKRPGGEDARVTIGGIELMHGTGTAELPVLLMGLRKEDVPVGTEVWSVDAAPGGPAGDEDQVTRQQQTIEYAHPRAASRSARRRRVSARIVVVAWVAAVAGFAFASFHSAADDPLQWPAAMFTVVVGLYAIVMTLAHWVVLVPLLRARESGSRADP